MKFFISVVLPRIVREDRPGVQGCLRTPSLQEGARTLFHDWAALKLTGAGLPLTTARVRRLVLGSSGGWCTVQAGKVRSVPPWSALLGKGAISPGPCTLVCRSASGRWP